MLCGGQKQMILQKRIKKLIAAVIIIQLIISLGAMSAGASDKINTEDDAVIQSNEEANENKAESQTETSDESDEKTDKENVETTGEKEIQSESDADKTYMVVFKDGDSELAAFELKKGETVPDIPSNDKSGSVILGWICDGVFMKDVSDAKCIGDTVYSVWKSPSKKYDEHIQYMSGINGAFKPNEYITRAQFCVILDRLYQLTDNSCGGKYTDISEGQWYSESIYNVTSSAMMDGYPDGSFKPENPMTRAEFVAVMCKLYEVKLSNSEFNDIESHWAENEIKFAADSGWINGYSDGSFKPDSFMTRAETCAVMNRILERSAWGSTELLVNKSAHPFYDVGVNDWFFSDVAEATTMHSYTKSDVGEQWTDFTYLPNGYYEGITLLDDRLLYTDKNGQFAYLNPYSFMNINEKIYYIDGNGSIFMPIGLNNINNDLYYFSADHSVLCNDFYGNLYFGIDGKYTCGDENIDELVKAALAECTNDSMTQSEKLRAAYLYIRDNYKYLNRSHHPRGASYFVRESAEFMFKNKKGNCYCFASCFFLMAQRLGYEDAYIVSGGVGTNNSDHAWVMIYSKIYDVELEYAYLYRYANRHNYNLYNMTVGKTPFVYYFPY